MAPAPDAVADDPDGFRAEVAVALRATAEVFRDPNLRRAQMVLATFTFLDVATWLALLAYAYVDGGASAVGVVALVLLIPAAIAAPFGAALGDRWRRERVLVVVFVLEAAMCSVTAFALFARAPSALVYLPAVFVGIVLTQVRPLHAALVPWLARSPEALTATYASAGLLESVGLFIGPALAGLLLALGQQLHVSGAGIVFAVAAALMLVAAGLVARIRVHTQPPARERVSRFLADAVEGFGFVWRDRRPRLLVALLGTLTLVYGLLETLTVVLAFQVLGTGQAGVGLLNMAFGIGAILGGGIAVALAARRLLTPTFRGGVFLTGVPLASISALAAPVLVPPMLGLAGAGGVITDVAGRTMLQRLVPDEKLTRAFGVVESLYVATEGIGGFIGAVLVTSIGLRPALLIAGVLLPLVTIVAHRRIADLDVGVRIPEAEMAVLRGTGIFAPLPPASLERIARNLVPVRAQAGTDVIRQGDVGDRFYVIRGGTGEVRVRGEHLSSLGPGDCFGEIALLRDVLRTATVSASTDLDLLSLERDLFLEAVTGYPASREAAETEAERRLAAIPDAVPSTQRGDAGPSTTVERSVRRPFNRGDPYNPRRRRA